MKVALRIVDRTRLACTCPACSPSHVNGGPASPFARELRAGESLRPLRDLAAHPA